MPADEEHLPLTGRIVIQGLAFDWVCEFGALLKVYHPHYGLRIVELGTHYEPHVLANLVALGMLTKRSAPRHMDAETPRPAPIAPARKQRRTLPRGGR
jgi:hypothetical protein